MFNPFSEVSCRYGAPMGRPSDPPAAWDGETPLFGRHCGGDGTYDRGGAYWGHSRVYAVYTEVGDFCAYVEARSPRGAVDKVKDRYRATTEIERNAARALAWVHRTLRGAA